MPDDRSSNNSWRTRKTRLPREENLKRTLQLLQTHITAECPFSAHITGLSLVAPDGTNQEALLLLRNNSQAWTLVTSEAGLNTVAC